MKSEKFQNIALGVLFVAVITLTIAYAAMSQTLNITANATVGNKTTSWNVHFVTTGTTCTAKSGTKAQVTNDATTTATDISGLAVKLRAPGDEVTCTFSVQNEGLLDAKITNFTAPTGTIGGTGADHDLVAENIEYSLEYASNDTISANETPAIDDTLASNTTRPLVLTIRYKSAATDLPENDVTITNINSHFIYGQA